GLVRADGRRKPGYDALKKLIKGEWWVAPTARRTDEAGRVRVSGFAGEYAITAQDARGTFALPVGSSTPHVALARS
ncbi:MAG: endo-1,4-beta-xylanase, partial [Microcella sp.]